MKFLSLLVLSIPFIASAQSSPNTFEITGTIQGLSSNSVICITDVNNSSDTLAKTVCSAEKFVLKGKMKEAGLFSIYFEYIKKRKTVFIGAEKIKIEADASDIENMKVTGSATHDLFVSFQNTFKADFERISKSNEAGSTVSFTDEDMKKLE